MTLFLSSCGGTNSFSSDIYPLHKNISVTTFWIGETGSVDNGYISNHESAWDDKWLSNYGGVDDPTGNRITSFTPKENPFYVALPYNDFDETGAKKVDLASYIPWATSSADDYSICKNRWVMIVKGDKTVYAQWEDVGPFGEDDKEYVFSNALPKNTINNHAGIDVSPAVRDYLDLKDIDVVDWKFVDDIDVPEGAWKKIVTKR